MVAAHQPNVIFTDINFWEKEEAINLIKELRQANSTPVVVWTNKISEKIMAAVFDINYIFYIKKSENETQLLDAISKTFSQKIVSWNIWSVKIVS